VRHPKNQAECDSNINHEGRGTLMTIRELVEKYKKLCYYCGPVGMDTDLTIIDTPEVRAVLKSVRVNIRAFVGMEQDSLLAGCKCLQVRVPWDVWTGKTTINGMPGDKADAIGSVEGEVAELRAHVTDLKHEVDAMYKYVEELGIAGFKADIAKLWGWMTCLDNTVDKIMEDNGF